jgi:DNA helicase II / ATP-dependent DNA helicase PcrA
MERDVVNKDQKAVINALRSMNYTENNLYFNRAMDYLEKYAESERNQDENVLILEDIKVWRKHWDSFLRSRRGGEHSLATFLGQVALGTTQQPKQEGIALLTVHSAQGLEFDIVVVVGMTEGTFPDYRAKGYALQEEKRNMFVAITRSKRLLAFSYPKTKIMPWGSIRKQKPSRYLTDIGLVKNN